MQVPRAQPTLSNQLPWGRRGGDSHDQLSGARVIWTTWLRAFHLVLLRGPAVLVLPLANLLFPFWIEERSHLVILEHKGSPV